MSLRFLYAFLLLAVSNAALADAVDINLRDKSAQLQYFASVGRDSLGTSDLHMGILYTKDNNRMVDFGLLVKGAAGSYESGLSAGVGLKALVASVNHNDAVALALGGLVRYSPPPVPRLGLVYQLYFSPNIVTYRDAERVTESVARVEYEVIPQALVYLGYRRISFNITGKPLEVLDTGFHVGVRMSF